MAKMSQNKKISLIKNNTSSSESTKKCTKNIIISNSNSNSSASPSSTKKQRKRKSIPRDSPPQRSSIFRGVTRHRWTGRFEAHLWDKDCWNESQTKKGRQVYLGAYDDEEAAARAYDLAALKYWGQHTILNFPISNYQDELKDMEGQSKEEYIGSLRRKSSGFSRGVSKYRGVARHHHNGRWEARIGRVFGNKYLYLGTYATQEEAAMAYDMAAIEHRGLNAVTNFDLSRYINLLQPKIQEDNKESPNNNNENLNPSSNKLELGFNISHQHHHDPTTKEIGPENNLMQSSSDIETSKSSALGILLQSSKFKEMLERTTSSDTNEEPLESSKPTRRTFPEDIQTFFEDHDSSSSYTNYENDDIIFGDLCSLPASIFHFELDS